jgi:hypothetical protein
VDLETVLSIKGIFCHFFASRSFGLYTPLGSIYNIMAKASMMVVACFSLLLSTALGSSTSTTLASTMGVQGTPKAHGTGAARLLLQGKGFCEL